VPQLDDLTIDELIEDFEFLPEWEDRYDLLIDLGRKLADLPTELKVEQNLVRGCQSQVWFVPRVQSSNGRTTVEILAKSDALIVDGEIVLLLTIYNGKTPAEILAADPKAIFKRLGLDTHLSPQRRNGLYAMVGRIQEIARNLEHVTAPAARPLPAELTVSDDRSHPGGIERLDAHRIKQDFPVLQQEVAEGMPVTYLDTAASAQKPQVVIDRERQVYEQYYANGGHRGIYRFADRIDRELEESRSKVQKFIGAAHSSEIIFTSGTTMGINLVAQAWGRKILGAGDEVLLNVLEHHANIVPWQWIAGQTGATIRYIPLTDDGQLDLSRLDEVLSARTRIVGITGMSNVLGTAPPVSEIARRARQVGALVLVDGAQSVPHMPVNVLKDQVDFLAFSGHKLYGPSGVGCLYGRRELLDEMDPFLCGGHMIDHVTKDGFAPTVLPAKFEAGTLPIAQAIALGAAIDYVNNHGLCHIHTHEQTLLRYATQRLQEVPGLKIYGPPTAHKGAIVSFTVEGTAAHDLAQLLDLKGVCVRHGHHCAMPLHDYLGVPGTVRASFAFYNTTDDVDTLVEAIQFAREKLLGSSR
jgi:cysteine desulfurase / selenocysteine lyase